MRTIIEIPPGQLDALAKLCAQQGISRAEAIRRAVAMYLGSQAVAAPDDAAFGLWRGRQVASLAYEDELREEWKVAESRPRHQRPR